MGGARGRLTPIKEKQRSLDLIDEAVEEGSGLILACNAAGISISTYRRWKEAKNLEDQRQFAEKKCSFQLTNEEQKVIVETCCSERYKDETPYTIYANLLEEGIYLGSIITFYRVLKKNNLIKHRTNKKPGHKHSKPPERVATESNQVWTWDITWLPTCIKGHFVYQYSIIDIWDKTIVGWEVHDCESDQHATELFQRTLREQGYPNVYIHSDNGNPMKGISLLSLFYKLDLINSYSRPRVSNDNPFIESFFGTMKYHRKYPGKFRDVQSAREWLAGFLDFYHNQHRHSGLDYFTPNQMRSGAYKHKIELRNETMSEAYKTNPKRWTGKNPKQWKRDHVVFLNPSEENRGSHQNRA